MVIGRKTPPVALTIAGSDSGGGAGVQADLKSFAANGVYGTCAITAITAQNTTGVKSILMATPQIVEAQILSVINDFSVRSVKTGMLGEPEIADVVAFFAKNGDLPRLIVDPVMVATSGDSLSSAAMIDSYRNSIFKQALVITPNITEAELLAEMEILTLTDMAKAARILHRFGSKYVYVKGGHLDGDESTDILFDGKNPINLRASRINSVNVHGTGCTFSAALAAGIARGLSVEESVRSAKIYTTKAIAEAQSWVLGGGAGPLDHFGWSRTNP